MIEIKIRHIDDSTDDSISLGKCELTKINEVVQLVKDNEVSFLDSNLECTYLCSSIVINGKEVYFEIVVD